VGRGRASGQDPLARLLEYGLVAVLVLAPLPFGAVGPEGRRALELGALLLLLIWLARALRRPTPLPSGLITAGTAGLMLLGMMQLLPLSDGIVSRLSPRSMEIRLASRPAPAELAAESRLLGSDPRELDAPAALSVDPGATASALRTGSALAALLLVATTVAATRGIRLLALALLVSAGLQGLYGVLVLVSGHDQIWHLDKQHYLDSATGTFVNRNHFAGYLAMALACGSGLIVSNAGRQRGRQSARNLLLQWFGSEGSRSLLLLLPLVVGLAGLLASFSRAGIALGLLAVFVTLFAGRGLQGLRVRLVVMLLVLAAATLPLLQIGSDRLVDRYAESTGAVAAPGARGMVWGDTLSIARAFPLCGSGFGTFFAVYPAFRSPDVRLYYPHAHNDLLQALAEGGVAGGLFGLLILIPLLGLVLRTLTGRKGTAAVGFAAGLAAILLHALVDFNFHIPANAATAAILAGGLVGLPWTNRT